MSKHYVTFQMEDVALLECSICLLECSKYETELCTQREKISDQLYELWLHAKRNPEDDTICLIEV